jgi:hypothetical protein
MRRTGRIAALLAILLPTFLLPGCATRESAEEKAAKEIEALASVKELGLVEYRVRKIVKANDEGEWYKLGERKILFSCTAYLKAGIDLGTFSLSDVDMDRETGTVTVTLPHATLLSVNIPASEIRQEYDQVTLLRSSFSAQERNLLLRQGERQIRESVLSLGILEKAEENATLFFTSLFSKMGFSTIEVKFK